MKNLNKKDFQIEINKIPVSLYTIKSKQITCNITNFGARTVSIIHHGKKDVDIVLGFDNIMKYLEADEQYHGAIVGRYANRVGGGKFHLNGKAYSLAKNNDGNTLHGGVEAFHIKVWEVVSHDEKSIRLRLFSPDMEEGFPGNMTIDVLYEVTGNELIVSYSATTDSDTFVNLTHHPYFNLNGEGEGDILDHEVVIHGDAITEVDETCIPTGHLMNVANTPFDFIKGKRIGENINDDHDQLEKGFGYDHNYVLRSEDELKHAAVAKADKTNIQLDIYTTEPGVQFYTGNHLSGKDIGKSNRAYKKRHAFCLETQHFPDSPNVPSFPSTLLRAGEKFESLTKYVVSEF